VAAARALSVHRPPRWLDAGSGRAFFDFGTLPKELHEMLGDIPPAQLDWSRALRWSPRVNDPNAGKAPADFFSTNNPSGYQQPYYYEGGVIGAGNFREHSWIAGHAPNHIGGTMRPVQGVPKFSPFYIEFEEYFGGYNFGGGNGQLDFLNMRLDWACG
jgi:hypothetical protein